MPAIVKLRVMAARELPVMDRSSELTDAFVEVESRTHAPLQNAVCNEILSVVYL